MSNVKKYKKKPVEIEAIQLTFKTVDECLAFCGNAKINETTGEFQIKTLEGVMTAKIGDYIIKGLAGEFYPCDKDIFNKSYERTDKVINNLPKQTAPFNSLGQQTHGGIMRGNPVDFPDPKTPPVDKFWYGYDPYKKEDGCPSNPKMTTVDRVKCGTNPQKGMEPDVNFKDEVDRGYKNNEYPLSPNECFQKKEKHFEGKVEPMKYDTKISKKDFEELISFFLK